MKIVKITNTSYPSARELPNKSGRPINKHQKSPGGNSGGGKHGTSNAPRPAGRLLADLQKADREATQAGKMYLVVFAGRKRKFIRESDYLAGNF
jgi:hypothetical protein